MVWYKRFLELLSHLRSRLTKTQGGRRPLENEADAAEGYATGEDFPEEIEWYPIEGAPWEEACDGLQSALGECDGFFD